MKRLLALILVWTFLVLTGTLVSAYEQAPVTQSERSLTAAIDSQQSR